MTKTATAVNGKTTVFETDKLTGIHDRGVTEDGKPIVKLHFGTEPARFIFGTAETVTSPQADITIDP